MGRTQVKGKHGEDLAAGFLRKQGFRILARNVRTPYGEIDLICHDGHLTMFVEVKYRSNKRFGDPEDAVVGKKHDRLSQSVEWYVTERHVQGDYRLDVVTVHEAKPWKVLHHIQDV